MKLPVAFQEKMKNLLQDEYEAYLASYQLPKYQGFRINTLKLNKEEWEKINPFESLKPVPWCETGYYYNAHQKPAKHPYYFAGLYYIQEPSAMAPGAYLPIEEGDHVLDLCAAPGGKSTQIAAKLNQTGVLVSNDISASRVKALAKNLENFGAANVIVTSENSERLAAKWPGYFDKILIDAPCSGEGMFRKNESAIKSWEAYGVMHCCHMQQGILEDAAVLLKPNGMILYSTCTFSPEENEGMIGAFIEKHPDFKVVPLQGVGGIQAAHPEWAGVDESLKGALRLWPHHLEGEGHFVCLLQREGEAYTTAVQSHHKCLKDFPAAYDFMKEHTYLSGDMPVREHNQKIYKIMEDAPELEGLRVIRGGLLLGELKNKRFEPSHAMVLAFPKEMFKHTLNFDASDELIKRYLKGETLLYEAAKGYHVVCVDNYPLGWVKAQNGMLKNQYPASWRMMG